MSVQKYLDENKGKYRKNIDFIETPSLSNEEFPDIFELFNIQDIKVELNEILQLLATITEYHHQYSDFYTKIEQIIIKLKESIKKSFTNREIFNIFKRNKKLILFLIKEEIITIDQNIALIMTSEKYSKLNYPLYFYPELKDISNQSFKKGNSEFDQIELLFSNNPKLFERFRQRGENESLLCETIRYDLLDDFKPYYEEKRKLGLVNQSVFEAHPLLQNKRSTYLEYSAFYGSIKIFKYLISEEVEIPPSIWKYAIHSPNRQIIEILEQNHIWPAKEEYNELLKEIVKCHHNDLLDHFNQNYLQSNLAENIDLFSYAIKYHNYDHFPSEFNNDLIFYNLCKYNYVDLVERVINEVSYDCKIDKIKKMKNDNESIEKERTPLYIAAEKGNNDIVNLLLSQEKIEVNRKLTTKYHYFYKDEIREKSAIHIALEKRNFDTVQILLNSNKIEINQKLNYSFIKHSKSCTQNQEKTLLYLAIEKENEEIVQSILSHENVDVNIDFIHDEIGSSANYHLKKSPLYLAVEKNLNKIACLLISNKNTNVNSETTESSEMGTSNTAMNETALHLASLNNNVEVAASLLEREDIDINAKKVMNCNMLSKIEKKQLTALQIASIKGNDEIASLLLNNDKTEVNYIAEIVTSEFSRNGLRNLFATERILVSVQKKTALHFAVENRHLNVVDHLLKRDDIDVNIRSIFSYDSKHEFNQMKNEEEEAVEGEIDNEKSALCIAIENKDFDIVKSLLESSKIKINSLSTNKFKGNFKDKKTKENELVKFTDLHVSAAKGTPEIVELMISQKGIKINSKFVSKSDTMTNESEQANKGKEREINKTALHIAFENNNSDIVKILLRNENIDINSILLTKYKFIEVLNERKKTIELSPLFMAIQKGMLDIAELLLERDGIDINLRCKTSEDDIKTALSEAVFKDNMEIVKLLLDKDNLKINDYVTINFTDYSEEDEEKRKKSRESTSLHVAVRKENLEMVNLLLSRDDIDVNIPEKTFVLLETVVNALYTSKSNKLISEKPALAVALEVKNSDIAQLLLEQPEININAKSLQYNPSSDEVVSETPIIHTALSTLNLDVFEILIQNSGLDLEATDEEGNTIVQLYEKNQEMIKNAKNHQ
ncbi:hypothetical protein M9Y10_017936 [Tritrichomonas musculus]|uniref:Ankyrin repeat protein n=1 Tax=Tritrichomonas musculus TaxID=1915356 RepID=A0ABR2HV49_9EUKA